MTRKFLVPASIPTPYSYAHINADTPGGASTVWTTYSAWTVDTSSGITYSAGTWTVPTAGRYNVNGMLSWSNSTTGLRGMQFLINNVVRASFVLTAVQGAAVQSTVWGSMSYPLAVSDTIAIQGYQNSGTTLNVRGDTLGSFTNCQIEYVGP